MRRNSELKRYVKIIFNINNAKREDVINMITKLKPSLNVSIFRADFIDRIYGGVSRRQDKNQIGKELLAYLKNYRQGDRSIHQFNIGIIITTLGSIHYQDAKDTIADFVRDSKESSYRREVSIRALVFLKAYDKMDIIRKAVLDKKSGTHKTASSACMDLLDIQCIPYMEKLKKRYHPQSPFYSILRDRIKYIKDHAKK